MKLRPRVHKAFSVITSLLMLVQPILPAMQLATPPVYAQEITPTESQTPTPEPTTEQTSPTPTEEIQPTPTEEATPTPTTETTPSVTPETTPTVVPTDTVTPTPGEQNQAPQQSSNEPPKETGPPETGDILDGVSTEATPSPTVTPEQPEEGVLHASVLQNVEAASLDLDNIDPSNSATLATDKADYAPTDTAIITGTDFTPGESYNLTISSNDPPATSTTVQVTADENGMFVYAYQLDGIYRPNYLVEAKELDGTSVDVVTFTDSDTSYKTPTATHSPNDWDDNSVAKVQSSNDTYATDNDEDEQGYGNFDFPTIPAGSTINGIEVKIEAKSSDPIGCRLETNLSWNNGSTYTSIKTAEINGTDAVYTHGGSGDTWGRTWSASDFTNANFVLKTKVDDVSGSSCTSGANASIDHIQVKVHYTESGASSGVQTAVGQCVQDAYGANVQCTANDVSIANVTNVQILDDGCTSPSDTVTFKATWNVQSTATERYNIGLYFASQGQLSALTGTCAVSTLANAPVPPNYNFDGNACGDISSAGSVNPEITMTVQCKDPDGDNTLNLPYCTSWNQNIGENLSCSTPANAIPGSPSKCNCQNGFEVPVTVPHFANIEVVKDLAPANDAGTFNLTVDGTTEAACVGDAGTTGKVSVTAGTNQNPGATHTVGETMCNGTSASNYTTSISCVDRGQTTFNGGSALTSSTTGPLNVPVGKDDDIVCTITNTRNYGHLTVQKTTIPSGSQQSFAISATGSGTITGGGAGSITDSTDQTYEVTAGTYSVTETVPSGWTQTGNTCTDVAVSAGGNASCTITNTQKGHIVVNKITSGADDTFTFTTTGSGYNGFSLSNGQSNDQEVVPGSYTVSETALTGWSSDGGVCDNGETPGSLDVEAGETVTCTFTNTKLRNITACKYDDVNGNGTKDDTEPLLDNWSMTLTPGSVTQATVNGCTTFTDLSPGSYSVAETLKDGWANTTPLSQNVTLTSASNETLSFGNFACAVISGVKWEDLDGDGVKDAGEPVLPDWTINLNGTEATDVTDENGAYTFSVCRAGTHTITETIPDADVWYQTYPGGASPNHQVQVTSGGSYTDKNFGNTRYAKIYGVKYRDNDGDGILDANDLTATLAGWVFELYDGTTNAVLGTYTTLTDGYYEFTGLLVNKTYYVLEQLKPGWTQTIGPTPTPTPFAVQSGETKEINFANFENMSVTVCKVADADGSITTTDDRSPVIGWEIDLLKNSQMYDDTKSTGRDGCYTWTDLPPGSYSTEEENRTGWQNLTATSHDFGTLVNGQQYSHTFINTQMGKILVEKQTFPDGSNQSFGFTADYDANGFSLTDGQTNDSGYLTPGTYSVSETGVTGWDLSSAVCSDQSNPNTISLSAGETVTCTFTNTKRGHLIVQKTTIPANDEDSFSILATGSGSITGGGAGTISDDTDKNYEVTPGTYSVSETVPGNWDQTGNTCTDVAVGAGETKTCEITNTKRGNVTVIKYYDHNRNGKQDIGDEVLGDTGAGAEVEATRWEIHLVGTNVNASQWTGAQTAGQVTFSDLIPGAFTVSEQLKTGWLQSNISCGTETAIDNDNSHPVTVTAGQTTTCAIGNYQQGRIIIEKQTIPDGSKQEFAFTASYDGDGFNLADGTQNDSGYLTPGSYSVTETVPSGWTLTNTVCTSSNQDTETADSLDLDPGETITCVFTNTERGRIIVDKITNPSEEETEFSFTASGSGYLDFVLSDTDDPNDQSLLPGEYAVSETVPTGWDLSTAVCTSSHEDTESIDALDLSAGEIITCTFTNTKRGTVIVTKYNDENGNGQRDEGEDVLSGWTMNLNGDAAEEVTGENGEAVFTNVIPGEYTLTEKLQNGWEQTELSCGEQREAFADDVADVTQDPGSFTLSAGETQYCVVGNRRLNPILTITKANNAAGDKAPGENVLFTLTVTATQSAAFNVVVTDLPPAGFTYRGGSWTSVSTARGNLKVLGITTEPTYHSPGVWILGDMVENETVTLTYIADISSDQKPGLYKDLAWAFGCRYDTDCAVNDGNDVVALAVSPGFIDETNHVGTDVNIVRSTQSGASLNPTTGEVLGASTELPATGADDIWLLLAAFMLLAGIGLLTAGKYTRRLHA